MIYWKAIIHFKVTAIDGLGDSSKLAYKPVITNNLPILLFCKLQIQNYSMELNTFCLADSRYLSPKMISA
jgi:hypothetical protein